MNLNYQVKKTVKEDYSIFVEDENFISIYHIENGVNMITAFIGKGGANKEKLSIKVSYSGGILEIKTMYGTAHLNATSLLECDSRHKVISNNDFKDLYNKMKERLVQSF